MAGRSESVSFSSIPSRAVMSMPAVKPQGLKSPTEGGATSPPKNKRRRISKAKEDQDSTKQVTSCDQCRCVFQLFWSETSSCPSEVYLRTFLLDFYGQRARKVKVGFHLDFDTCAFRMYHGRRFRSPSAQLSKLSRSGCGWRQCYREPALPPGFDYHSSQAVIPPCKV